MSMQALALTSAHTHTHARPRTHAHTHTHAHAHTHRTVIRLLLHQTFIRLRFLILSSPVAMAVMTDLSS